MVRTDGPGAGAHDVEDHRPEEHDQARRHDHPYRHRDDDHIQTVGQQRNPEGEPLLAGHRVDPDQADRQADRQRGETADSRRSEHRGHRDEGQHHDREIVRRTETAGEVGDDRSEHDQ